jgi:hypothetical protein
MTESTVAIDDLTEAREQWIVEVVGKMPADHKKVLVLPKEGHAGMGSSGRTGGRSAPGRALAVGEPSENGPEVERCFARTTSCCIGFVVRHRALPRVMTAELPLLFRPDLSNAGRREGPEGRPGL